AQHTLLSTLRASAANLTLPARNALRSSLGKLNLRAKFLISLALVILGLMTGALLMVRQSLESQSRRQSEQEAHNGLLTFQLLAQQQRLSLSHKAELLATLAFLRDGDAAALRDASQDPWQSEDCDLFALIDAKGRITALQTRSSELSASAANQAIASFL